MLVALANSKSSIPAWKAERDMSPFSCPECGEEVVLHKGQVRVHHYKHKPPITCPYGSGESDEHYTAKKELYESLSGHPNIAKFEIEYRGLAGTRPDVYFETKTPAYRVAIELQKSSQKVDDVERRTVTYNRLGVHVIWIFPQKEPSWVNGETSVCKVQSWHEYFHLMFFGRVYFWQSGRTVRAAHLGKFFRDIPSGNWVEDYENKIGEDLSGTHWYDDTHGDAYYGGGRRLVKSFKEVRWAERSLDLLEDFRASTRDKEFRTKRYVVPVCRIWMDRLRSWWPKEEFRQSF